MIVRTTGLAKKENQSSAGVTVSGEPAEHLGEDFPLAGRGTGGKVRKGTLSRAEDMKSDSGDHSGRATADERATHGEHQHCRSKGGRGTSGRG